MLGRGWDLRISTIDVRGPSPLYNPAYETEDYALDGGDLIALDAAGKDIPPLYKGGPIIPRITGMRLFRLRNNSDGLIVRRFGDAPATYFWEIWDPNSGVTKLYGAQFDKASLKLLPTGDNGVLKGTIATGGARRLVIGQWGLTQEFDNQPAHNGAHYTYVQDSANGRQCDSSWEDECSPALRLASAEYNQVFGQVPASAVLTSGMTTVRFAWKRRTPARFNSDGRLGFFRAQEWWLTELDVVYRPEQHNVWLAVASNDAPSPDQKDVLFARHRFTLTDGDEASSECMNFDRVLDTYEVEANQEYDVGDPLKTQAFHF